MPTTLLFLALFFLFLHTMRAMTRLRRVQLVRLLAVLMKRQMPLYPALVNLAEKSNGPDEELLRKLAFRLWKGEDLPYALRRLNVLSRQQMVALSIAEEHNAGAALLDVISLQMVRGERRVMGAGVTAGYPLLMGIVLLAATLFYAIKILPKFEVMFKEMDTGLIMPITVEPVIAMVGILFGWGVLSLSLNMAWLGRHIWWHVPVLGTHFRMQEQANLARVLSLTLSSGASLERALNEIVSSWAGGPLQPQLQAVCIALNNGVPLTQAFHSAGRWRVEFLWALDSIAAGTPASPVLEQVARVLEDKVDARLNAFQRVCTPIAVIISAAGVGLLAWTVFKSLEMLKGILFT